MHGQFLGVDALMTPQLNVAVIRKVRGSLMCFAYYFDMLSMGVCTTSHWQTSGRLVQELNVYTVLAAAKSSLTILEKSFRLQAKA